MPTRYARAPVVLSYPVVYAGLLDECVHRSINTKVTNMSAESNIKQPPACSGRLWCIRLKPRAHMRPLPHTSVPQPTSSSAWSSFVLLDGLDVTIPPV